MVMEAIGLKVQQEEQDRERKGPGHIGRSLAKGGRFGHRDPEFLERARAAG
jgi:hypothetical protein